MRFELLILKECLACLLLKFWLTIDDFSHQVVGIGNAGVGKTCLVKSFCESKVRK